MRPSLRSTRLAALLVVVPLLLAGCSDDGGDEPATGTSSAEDAPSDAGSDDPDATESDEPSAEPASGPEISTDSVTLNAPEGWEVQELSSASTVANPTKGPPITLSVKDFPVNTGGEVLPLAEVARTEVKAESESTDPKILPETEIAGEPVFHLAGDVSSTLYLESWGPSVADRSVVVGFKFLKIIRENRRQEIIDEVLASVEWTY